jgi:tRNA (guanine-N7-)-methyltransferase
MNIENDDTASPGVEDDEAGGHDLRSYGRRRGRRLSDRQARLMTGLLPRLKLDLAHPPPADPTSLFAPPAREVWMEIGFGGGEHLLWQARANPDVGIIGCEPFEDGLVKVLTAIEEDTLANIRLWPDDARAVLRWLPPASVDRMFVLFPDPWPKKRHQKRRLLSAATLGLVADVLKPGGELRIGTDIADYARTIFMALAATPSLRWTAARSADWRHRPDDWPETRYEQKAIREGRPCCYLRFERAAMPARTRE